MTGLPFRRYAYVLLMLYIISDSYTEGRKGARSVSLEVGPKYDGGPTSTEEFHETELLNEKKSDSDTYDESGSPSKYSLHGSLYQPDPSSVWLEQALSNTAREARVWPSSDPSHFEDDPFLVPRVASTKITGSFPPNDHHAPYSTAQRHQSTRRNLVQRIPSGTRRTSEHYDGEYEDIPLDHDRYARNGDGLARPEKSYSSPRKERGLRELGDGEDETEWIAGTGFRLVYEDEDHEHSSNGASQRLIEDDSQNRLSRLLFHNDNWTPPQPDLLSAVVNLSGSPEYLISTRRYLNP